MQTGPTDNDFLGMRDNNQSSLMWLVTEEMREHSPRMSLTLLTERGGDSEQTDSVFRQEWLR